MSYLTFIDGLRAIAVLSVLLYHLKSSLVPNGYLGVDIFFIISGFVVSYTISQHKKEGYGDFLISFYARRFSRIMPALLACLTVTGLFVFLFIPRAWLSDQIYSVGSYAYGGLSNLKLAKGSDYFSPRAEYNPFSHTWSLGVEEQFYLIFPLMFLPWLASERGKIYSIAIFSIAAGLSAAIWLNMNEKNSVSAFYMIYARFWQLALGVVCFQVFQYRDRSFKQESGLRLGNAITTLLLGGLVLFLFLPMSSSDKYILNILVSLITASIIALMWQNTGDPYHVQKILDIKAIRYIGKISFSLYLWHWPVFILAHWTYGLDDNNARAIALLLTAVLTCVSYYLIETPVRRFVSRRAIPSHIVVISGLICTIAAWGVYQFGMSYKDTISRSVVNKNISAWYPHEYTGDYGLKNGCRLEQRNNNGGASFVRTGCDDVASDQRNLYAIGDSHTEAYSRLLGYVSAQTGMTSTMFVTVGCPYVSFDITQDTDQSCINAANGAGKVLENSLAPGDIVFMSSLRLPRFSDQWVRFKDEDAYNRVFSEKAERDRLAAVEYGKELLKPILAAGATVIIEAPKPIFKSPTFRCSDWFNAHNPLCSSGSKVLRSEIEAMRAPILDAMYKLAAISDQIHIWDSLPLLCSGPEYCGALLEDGTPLFFDGDHVSGAANDRLAAPFIEFLNSID